MEVTLTDVTDASVGEALRRYLKYTAGGLATWTRESWTEMGRGITSDDIAIMVQTGSIPPNLIDTFSQVYSEWAADKLTRAARSAGQVGASRINLPNPVRLLDPQNFDNWVKNRAGRLVTSMSETQRQALQALLGRAVSGPEPMGSRTLASMLRPVIGLSPTQAAHIADVWAAAREDGATMANADKIASKAAQRLQKSRSLLIARTELATAHNEAMDQTIRGAIREGAISPDTVKHWLTQTTAVCKICQPLDGERVPMDGVFSAGVKLPPAHPRCRCVILYRDL